MRKQDGGKGHFILELKKCNKMTEIYGTILHKDYYTSIEEYCPSPYIIVQYNMRLDNIAQYE